MAGLFGVGLRLHRRHLPRRWPDHVPGVFGSAAPHAYDALLAVMRDIDDRA